MRTVSTLDRDLDAAVRRYEARKNRREERKEVGQLLVLPRAREIKPPLLKVRKAASKTLEALAALEKAIPDLHENLMVNTKFPILDRGLDPEGFLRRLVFNIDSTIKNSLRHRGHPIAAATRALVRDVTEALVRDRVAITIYKDGPAGEALRGVLRRAKGTKVGDRELVEYLKLAKWYADMVKRRVHPPK